MRSPACFSALALLSVNDLSASRTLSRVAVRGEKELIILASAFW